MDALLAILNSNAFAVDLLQLSLLFPGVFLAVVPLRRNLRFSIGVTSVIILVPLTIYCVLGALYTCLNATVPGLFIMLAIPIGVVILVLLSTFDPWRIIVVVFSSVALISFCLMGTTLIDAWMHPYGSIASFTEQMAMFQLVLAIGVSCCLIPFVDKQMSRLLRDFPIETLWKVAWIIPLAYVILLSQITPVEYRELFLSTNGYVSHWILLIMLFAQYILNFVLLNYVTRYLTNSNKLLQEKHFLEIQTKSYSDLQVHMNETARVRHDFRQQLRVIAGMAEQDDLDGLKRYLSEYTSNLAEERKVYCANPAVNALCDYYGNRAEDLSIECTLDFRLPTTLPLSEVDLCVIIGNLLENAVDGAATSKAGTGWLRAKAALLDEQTLGLIVTNSYNGVLHLNKKTFMSTKHAGNGIGIASVTALVEKHSGTIDFTFDETQFAVNVMLEADAPVAE